MYPPVRITDENNANIHTQGLTYLLSLYDDLRTENITESTQEE